LLRVSIVKGLVLGAVLAVSVQASGHDSSRSPVPVWRELEPGLELARFDSGARQASEAGDLIVLRVDPVEWKIHVLGSGPKPGGAGKTLPQWGETFNLVAAINAGMYQADRLTHVGYCKVDGTITNPSVNDYLSVMACDPLDESDPPFRIFDLDEISLREVGARYRTVVQNLRLIKRERENRWQPLGDRWAEAALGEDAQGRALLIYCTAAWSMHEFNEILLGLPLELVAAQHLEGRSQARIWLGESIGISGPGWAQRMSPGPVLPNVIGVARKVIDEE
jgi:Phosphodiester glycosidase